MPRSQNWLNNIRQPSTANLFIYNYKPKVLIYSKYNGEFIVIGQNVSIVNNVLNTFREEFELINNYSEDWGLSFDTIVTSRDLAELNLRSFLDIGSISYIQQKNSFESQVLEDISKITTCMLSNILITFPKLSETYEYDILIPMDQNNILDIEVTDYSTARSNVEENKSTLKQELILSPRDKASALKAQLIIVIKGFQSHTFEQMKNMASARNIILLNDRDYSNKIQEIILRNAIPKMDPMSFPYFTYNLATPSITTSAYLDTLRKYFDAGPLGESL